MSEPATHDDNQPIRIIDLDCWHANRLIYQAIGHTTDGRIVHVHYRGGRFSVWTSADDSDGSPILFEFFRKHDRPHDPSLIRLAELKAWTAEEPRIVWELARITGFDNEGQVPDGI